MALPGLSWFSRSQEYEYVFLEYQPSLSEPRVQTYGVVARLDGEDTTIYLLAVQRPDIPDASELTSRILSQLPEWTQAQVDEAMQEGADPLEYLADSNPYNLTFSSPRSRRFRGEYIEDVLRLFGERAFGDERALLTESERAAGNVSRERYPVAASTSVSVETPAVSGFAPRDSA